MNSLKHVMADEVDGTKWGFAALDGRPYVVVFGNLKVSDDVTAIIGSLQGDAETADLDIVQVAHVSGLAKPLRKLATRSLRKAKERQVAERAGHRVRLGLPVEAGERLRFALDWSGQITDPFEFKHDTTVVATLLVDASGQVVERIDGPDAAARIRAWHTSHVAAA